MKPVYKILISALIFILVFYKLSTYVNSNNVVSSIDSTAKRVEEITGDTLKYNKGIYGGIDTVAERKRYELLLPKFIKNVDEITNTVSFMHKTFGKNWPQRKTLYMDIYNEGKYYLRSNYFSSDWIFHTSVIVKVGDDILESETVETYNQYNHTENDGGYVWENIQYVNSIAGKAILRKIATNIDKKVLVRFVGKEYKSDVVLTKADKIAIKESLELVDLLPLFGNSK